MRKADVASYLEQTRPVEGWFFPVDAFAFAMFDEIQKREGITGNLFEIGVHHGKTAIMLARMAAPGEVVGVCDVFENQQENVDRSGEGSRELFLSNMRAFTTLRPDQLSVYAKRSSTLTEDETSNTCRFFHVDGGHRPQDVYGDLVTADRALIADGVIAVDDLFNPSWPGVSEGFYNFVSSRPDSLAPLFIGGNKVFFTRPDAAPRYDRYWTDREHLWHFFERGPFTFDLKEWFGHPVLTAVRSTWVDLDPVAAARAHLGPAGWKDLLKSLLRR
jgi:hypothetical protein